MPVCAVSALFLVTPMTSVTNPRQDPLEQQGSVLPLDQRVKKVLPLKAARTSRSLARGPRPLLRGTGFPVSTPMLSPGSWCPSRRSGPSVWEHRAPSLAPPTAQSLRALRLPEAQPGAHGLSPPLTKAQRASPQWSFGPGSGPRPGPGRVVHLARLCHGVASEHLPGESRPSF